MMQAGGGNWTHGISNDLVTWYTPQHFLFANYCALPTPVSPKVHHDGRDRPCHFQGHSVGLSPQGPCDGTVSFPNLDKPPYNGSTPVILYGPDCNEKLKPGVGTGVGDAPRVELALPRGPADSTLRDWVKQLPGPVVFDGTPCSFLGRVWKSEVGDYWNTVCALDGIKPPGPATLPRIRA
jgi:hypothetical protein